MYKHNNTQISQVNTLFMLLHNSVQESILHICRSGGTTVEYNGYTCVGYAGFARSKGGQVRSQERITWNTI